MFSLTVRGHMMVAHSLPRPVFGPAQGLHGATYVVEATFRRDAVDENGIVLDIGAATDTLQEILGGLRYTNLDDNPATAGLLTTTENLAKFVADSLAEQMDIPDISEIEVVLREHPDAWCSYRRSLS
ncbi:6-pyruvoyl trahydropterin synthase family protein [Cumulibacter manganitolerans]|uniref:6-pyruvoyl trahydropterin synthase family protein n=1 Tax=Cumulibacter manganitolerans TaxID=1884992 RepID=UPI0012968175|nr:6-carboxytetrahydropterin synthase [Cumulibacter manganitolerans]